MQNETQYRAMRAHVSTVRGVALTLRAAARAKRNGTAFDFSIVAPAVMDLTLANDAHPFDLGALSLSQIAQMSTRALVEICEGLALATDGWVCKFEDCKAPQWPVQARSVNKGGKDDEAEG